MAYLKFDFTVLPIAVYVLVDIYLYLEMNNNLFHVDIKKSRTICVVTITSYHSSLSV